MVAQKAKYKITKSQTARIADIQPSNTKPQEIRRKRYTPQMLAELAESIRTQGVLEQLIVRILPDGSLELVAGERRWRAAQIAGMEVVPVSIRELTDEQVVIIQLHENLHRENPHPLDEAYNYGYMRDEMKLTDEQIAHEVGKDVSYVVARLKLLELTESIREAYERKEISLSHIEEIAKYPKSDHEEIFSYCFSNFGHTSQALYPFKKAKEQIAQHYLLQLSKAPFRLDSRDLRPDGRTCLECHERTGANPLLWSGDEIGEKDSCFNRACYDGKVAEFVQLQRVSTATKVLSFPEEKTELVLQKEIPVVKTRVAEKIETNVPTVSIADIFVVETPCAFTKLGVIGDGEKVGKEVHFCERPSVCNVHRSDPPKSLEVVEEDKAAKLFQKEEDFQVKVGETVRREVLQQITKKLTGEEFVFSHPQIFAALTSRLWSAQTDSETDIIHKILDEMTMRTLPEFQTVKQQADELFMLIYAGKCQMTNAFVSQKEIRELAKDFGVDYQMIDAVKRLELAPDDHKKTFYNYLRKIEENERDTPIPQVWSEEWGK